MSTRDLPPELHIEVSHDSEAAVLSLCGELDLASAPVLSQAVDAVLRSPAPLRLDLSEVAFIDSSGLAALVRADLAVRAAAQSLRLVRPTPTVRRLLELTGMVDVFEIDDRARVLDD